MLGEGLGGVRLEVCDSVCAPGRGGGRCSRGLRAGCGIGGWLQQGGGGGCQWAGGGGGVWRAYGIDQSRLGRGRPARRGGGLTEAEVVGVVVAVPAAVGVREDVAQRQLVHQRRTHAHAAAEEQELLHVDALPQPQALPRLPLRPARLRSRAGAGRLRRGRGRRARRGGLGRELDVDVGARAAEEVVELEERGAVAVEQRRHLGPLEVREDGVGLLARAAGQDHLVHELARGGGGVDGALAQREAAHLAHGAAPALEGQQHGARSHLELQALAVLARKVLEEALHAAADGERLVDPVGRRIAVRALEKVDFAPEFPVLQQAAPLHARMLLDILALAKTWQALFDCLRKIVRENFVELLVQLAATLQ